MEEVLKILQSLGENSGSHGDEGVCPNDGGGTYF
jgi:hypothetical protein